MCGIRTAIFLNRTKFSNLTDEFPYLNDYGRDFWMSDQINSTSLIFVANIQLRNLIVILVGTMGEDLIAFLWYQTMTSKFIIDHMTPLYHYVEYQMMCIPRPVHHVGLFYICLPNSVVLNFSIQDLLVISLFLILTLCTMFKYCTSNLHSSSITRHSPSHSTPLIENTWRTIVCIRSCYNPRKFALEIRYIASTVL